jgi:GDPmannose 4,6-dehydratase
VSTEHASRKRALITGITGQDAAYLTELLLGDGYEVFGTYRPGSARNFWRLDELGVASHPNLRICEFEASSVALCRDKIRSTGVTEIYNLAGQSSAVASVDSPVQTAEANGMAVLYLLEAVRAECPAARFFQAGSAEMYGRPSSAPQTETTALQPTNPYGVSKVFAHFSTVNYRETYGIFASSGIFFNHESPLRSLNFVTRKITCALARIRRGFDECLELGNLEAKRDWGFAKDYAQGMLLCLRASQPDTFVFSTGRLSTVREFVTLAAIAAGFELTWEGNAERERGIDRGSGRTLVRVNPGLYRPVDINERVGDSGKANRLLGWRTSVSLGELCAMMVRADLTRAANRNF